MSASVFISYRRDTGQAYAGRLYDSLAGRFGDDHVFMDVDSIDLAEDFAAVLDQALDECLAVLVVIDPGWLDVLGVDGRRRLDDPDDFVRMEVQHALERGRKVFPILVGGAGMPQAGQLPAVLQPLAGRQALEITASRYRYDTGRLIGALERIIGTPAPQRKEPDPPAQPARRWRRRTAWLAAAAILVMLAALGLYLAQLPRPSAEGWQALPDAPVALEGAAMAGFQGKLWLAGGISASADRALLDAVSIYDPVQRSWTSGPALPQPVAFAALVNVGEELVLVGGQSRSGAVDAVLHLDPGSGRWVEGTSLPEARQTGAAGWDGSRLLYAGGVGTDHKAKDEVYALAGGSWEQIGRLSVAREKASAISDGFGTVWIAGGRDRASGQPAYGAVDVIQVESITRDADITPVHSAAGVWIPEAGPCLLGGDDGSGPVSAVSCLRGENMVPDQPELPEPTAGLAAAVLGQDVYVSGGYGIGSHGTAQSWVLRAEK